MKHTVENLSPTRVKLTVEVPFAELDGHFAQAYKTLAGQVRIPGFRPGHVPPKILDARIGRGTVLTEVVNAAIPVKLGEALDAAQLQPLGRPDVDVTKIDDNDVLEFTAEMDIRPEITLPALGDIEVSVDDVEVSEDDVDEQVRSLQERFATTLPVDRPVAEDDIVTLDLSASVDGTVLEEATATDLTYQVGSGELVAGIDEALLGANAGDSVTFTTKLVAGEYADQDADVTAAIKKVAVRELAEADDDFAAEASEFDTMEELRDDLRTRLRRVRNLGQASQARDKVLAALLEMTEIPLPEGIVAAEIEARQHDALHAFGHDEDKLNEQLVAEGTTREDFDAETKTAAEQAVKTQLLLDALAEAESVGVTQEEFTQRVLYNAQRIGMSPEEYFAKVQEADGLGTVFAEVRRGKALAAVVDKATITDASGNPVDLQALLGEPEADSADSPDSPDSADSAK